MSNMRLIDADALIKQMEADAEHMDDPITKMFYYAAINDVKHAPTIEERKTGEWTSEDACELCGFQPWYENDIHTLSFCPNCGADMRGVK